MNRRIPQSALPLLTVIPGCIILLLQAKLYTLEEHTGLLPQSHPFYIAALIIGIVTAVLMVILAVRRIENTPKVSGRSPIAAIGAVFAALLLIPAAFGIWKLANTTLEFFLVILAFVSVPCLLVLAWQFFRGRQPHFLLHDVLCLFFLVYMICQYPLWCGNPQAEDYLFPLFACVCLNFTAYRRAAFDFRSGNLPALTYFGWMAGFFCICSLAGDGDVWFYLAGGLWALTNLYSIQPPVQQEDDNVSA